VWRAIREGVFKTLNQVGGGLGDYIVQAAIDDKTAMKAIDGFGGIVGYDLDKIDTGSGPIRERAYEIICANLEPGSLLLQSLRQINAMKEMPIYEWILEMDAIYTSTSTPRWAYRRNRILKPSFTSICIPSFLSSFSSVNTPMSMSDTRSSRTTMVCHFESRLQCYYNNYALLSLPDVAIS
jgi:hypothetical protein